MPISPVPFCHIVIPAPDLAKAKAFYEAVFGWEVSAGVPGPAYWFFKSGNVGGAFSSDLKPAGGEVVPLFLKVEDMDAALWRIREHGGRVTRGKGALGEADPGFDARFQDPNGCELGLYSAT